MAVRSHHMKLLHSAHEAIVNLDLPELPANQIYRRKLITDRDTSCPSIIVALGMAERKEGLSFETVDRGYPVVLRFAVAANQDFTIEDDTILLWRQLVDDYFDEQSFGMSDEVLSWRCQVEHGPIIDPGAWQQSNLWLSYLVLWFSTHRARAGTA